VLAKDLDLEVNQKYENLTILKLYNHNT